MSRNSTATPQQKKLFNLHPSAFLLAAQLLMLILFAAFDGSQSHRAVLSAISMLVLVLVIWVVMRSSAIQYIAEVIAVPAFILTLLYAVFENDFLLSWSSLFSAVLYFYTAFSLIIYMMGDEQVTTDELFAVAATFTLMAWGFAYLFQVCQIWVPGSFLVGTEVRPLTFIESLFLSVTNLSTAGLSDIFPGSAWARVLIILEQFAGVLYVAMVVARLISMLRSRTVKRHG